MAAGALAGMEGKCSHGSQLGLPWEQDFHTTSEHRFVRTMEVLRESSQVTLVQKAPC